MRTNSLKKFINPFRSERKTVSISISRKKEGIPVIVHEAKVTVSKNRFFIENWMDYLNGAREGKETDWEESKE